LWRFDELVLMHDLRMLMRPMKYSITPSPPQLPIHIYIINNLLQLFTNLKWLSEMGMHFIKLLLWKIFLFQNKRKETRMDIFIHQY
jgi:hypothetical protein